MGRKVGAKSKNHIEYICPNCNKNFGCYKYVYTKHINKKYPCKPKDNICIKDEFDEDENNINNNLDNNNHNNTNNNIDNKNLNTENPNEIIISLLEKINELTKQNEEFKDDIQTLKKQITETSSKPKKNKNNKTINNTTNTTNTNSNNNINSNNTNNMTIQINNFSNMDYSKINPINLINTMLKNSGRNIYLMAIEDTFANPEKPQNHNLYISDKNRGYVKKYNDGRWNTDNLTIIETLITNFVYYAVRTIVY